MFNRRERLFYHRVILKGTDTFPDGLSIRYTMMSLLGLHSFETAGGRSPIKIEEVLPVVRKIVKERRELGDTGLYLWLCSLTSPSELVSCFREFEIEELWEKHRQSGFSYTMELSWFLTGLTLSARCKMPNHPNSLIHLANAVYDTIMRNYGNHGIFGHQNKGTFSGFLRGRIGTFADQVYPIYALSLFGETFHSSEAVRVALACASQICRHQGPQGQWWWHYDMVSGRVIGRYPVYSVHQDGMAPMALQAAAKAGHIDFSENIHKGLDWITGLNELETDMIDPSLNFIWRSFYPQKYRRYMEEAGSFLKLDSKIHSEELQVLYECRPYHLGWLLYAFASNAADRDF
jgi:hypothetical protein